MNKNTILILIMIFSLFGVAEAGLLTAAKYSDKVAEFCGQDPNNSCNTVQNSEYSYLINIKDEETGLASFQFPITLAGVMFFAILFIMTFIYYQNEKAKIKISQTFKKSLFWVGVAGVIFSMIFTMIQAYIIEAYCTYCLVSAANTIILLGLISKLTFCKK